MKRVQSLALAIVMVIYIFLSPVSCNGVVKVTCNRSAMQVTVSFPNSTQFGIRDMTQDVMVYLDKLKGYPGCHPELRKESQSVHFTLPLDENFYVCGTTKLANKLTGTRVFYHRIVIEERIKPKGPNMEPKKKAQPSSSPSPSLVSSYTVKPEGSFSNEAEDSGEDSSKEMDQDWLQRGVVVKCILPGETSLHPRYKRASIPDFLPDNFTESSEELIDYSGNVTAQAPLPLLNIAVRQNGQFVDTALNVSPGTPLEMIIYLDEVSASVYGLLTSFLRVTDNTPRKQEEVIILNGCSIDPYIFANFETEDEGKSLSAKFRAFKFPESNYVLFVGTVNVCLKSCQGVQCGEGQIGYGRKRRSIPYQMPFDPNKVFEAELTAFVKVGYTGGSTNGITGTGSSTATLTNSAQDHRVGRSLSGGSIEPSATRKFIQENLLNLSTSSSPPTWTASSYLSTSSISPTPSSPSPSSHFPSSSPIPSPIPSTSSLNSTPHSPISSHET